jgi:hypothetical protein
VTDDVKSSVPLFAFCSNPQAAYDCFVLEALFQILCTTTKESDQVIMSAVALWVATLSRRTDGIEVMLLSGGALANLFPVEITRCDCSRNCIAIF